MSLRNIEKYRPSNHNAEKEMIDDMAQTHTETLAYLCIGVLAIVALVDRMIVELSK